jgi:hypothetical protein
VYSRKLPHDDVIDPISLYIKRALDLSIIASDLAISACKHEANGHGWVICNSRKGDKSEILTLRDMASLIRRHDSSLGSSSVILEATIWRRLESVTVMPLKGILNPKDGTWSFLAMMAT